jgi:hypothetical protein
VHEEGELAMVERGGVIEMDGGEGTEPRGEGDDSAVRGDELDEEGPEGGV